jgi:hypothetical protein
MIYHNTPPVYHGYIRLICCTHYISFCKYGLMFYSLYPKFTLCSCPVGELSTLLLELGCVHWFGQYVGRSHQCSASVHNYDVTHVAPLLSPEVSDLDVSGSLGRAPSLCQQSHGRLVVLVYCCGPDVVALGDE